MNKQIDRNLADDLEKLSAAFFKNLRIDNYEFGGIGIDSKRPFGNSDVKDDILEIIEWEPEGDDGDRKCYASYQNDYACDLYREKLIPYLKARWEFFTEK